jgi:hypothetical protein
MKLDLPLPKSGSAIPARAPGVADPAAGLTSPFVPALKVVHTDRILRIQGYTDLSRVRPAILKAAQWAAQTIAEVATPMVGFKRLGFIRRGSDRIELSDGTVCNGAALVHELAGCDEVIVFVQTLGDGPDKNVIELLEDGEGLLEALLLETAGWLALEGSIHQFKEQLRADAMRRGRRLRKRLGPGYTYALPGGPAMWPLQDQRSLFAVFKDGELPVRLLDSCAMQPKLSRSGLFGEGPDL